ncbi:MAG: Hsp70 family protein [Pirellulaceae bacterium]
MSDHKESGRRPRCRYNDFGRGVCRCVGELQAIKGPKDSPLFPARCFSDHVLVGQDAVDLSEQALDDFAEGFKRDIGKPHYRRPVRLCEVPPEVLTAFLVEHLVANTREVIGEVREVVVTVPAYFDERQRSATRRAVALTGVKVLDIINEPTAAAIAAGYELMKTQGPRDRWRLLVFDLGGGTFDATLLELDGKIFKTLGTDGDIYLGGRDFDERIADIIAESFLAQHGVDPRCDPSDMLKLSKLAQEIKHSLSEKESFDVSFQHAGLLDGFTFTRKRFEEAVGPLIERTIATSKQVVADCGLQWNDIDEILLVGGSSRLPIVRRRLSDECNIPVRLADRPDELVARGAALYAAVRSEHCYLDESSRFEVVNVNAHSLGIQGIDLQTKLRVNRIIIPRNTPLPASSLQTFTTMEDGQKNVRVRLLEGESENPIFCTALGQCIVHLSPDLPQGTQIRVFCNYDATGTISVTANVPATKASAFVELRREGFAEMEPLAVWRQRLTIGDAANASDQDNPLPSHSVSLDQDSAIEELLARLDQIYSYVGRSVAETAVPTAAVRMQRLLNQSKQEAQTLKRLLDVLGKKQHTQVNSKDRMQTQGDLARVRMCWEQANKLYIHSCIGLGRIYMQDHVGDITTESLRGEAEQLQQWLEQRTTA